MRLAARACAVFVFASAAGCATPALQYPGIPVVRARIAALPSEVEVFEYDFDGKQSFDSKRAGDEKTNVDRSVGCRLVQHGGHAYRESALTALPDGVSFYQWTRDSLTEILVERTGKSGSRHETVGEWRFPREIGEWRAKLNVDFVLISLFIDGHDTMGRLFFSPDNWHAAHRAIACLVHLESGRIARCEVADPMVGELTSRPDAQAVVDGLLKGMFAEWFPEGGGVNPPRK